MSRSVLTSRCTTHLRGTAATPTPWTFTVAAPTLTGASGEYNIAGLTFAGGVLTGEAAFGINLQCRSLYSWIMSLL